MYETIRTDLCDGILTVTLTRPDQLNALNRSMAAELIAALDAADADDEVRAIIVTGDGRAFCAGSDLSAGAKAFDSESQSGEGAILPDGSIDYAHPAVRDIGGMITLRIYRCLKPIIAAINGPAVGIGVTMTLAMDVRLASESAKFGFVFARRGIVPEAASSWFLPRVVGIGQALDWCLSGRIFGATEAKQAGLVKSVHADGDLYASALMLAREIIDSVAPVSAALVRQMMWRGLGMSHPMEAHRLDSRAVYARRRSADAAEGAESFLQKRPAAFRGRVSADMPDFFRWSEEPPWA